MTTWKKLGMIAALAVSAVGCKEVINPHMKPEADASRLVASMAAATSQAMMARTANQQVILTINNAPEANEPLEQDFLTELVELFEKRNPNIRIQYSPWQYTPESFFERLNNRTLTDIVEVDAEQMVPIIEASAAADLTENVRYTPEMRIMNPDVFRVTSRDGRTYGVPTELHTMALFYNRRLLEESKIVVPDQKPNDVEKGKGAAGDPRSYVLEGLAQPLDETDVEVAQYYPPGYQAPQRSSRRSQREMENYYNQRPNRQQEQQRRQEEYNRRYYQEQQEYYRKHGRYFQPDERPSEDARERRVQSRRRNSSDSDEGDEESGTRSESESEDSDSSSDSRSRRSTSDDDSESTATVPDDTLTTEAELAMEEKNTTSTDGITTVIVTKGLPGDLEQFIRLAVRLTDHKKGIYGYAPVLYASEGGREYTQWSVLAGLDLQKINGTEVTLEVDKSGEVAQFLKDLHETRFDVTPEPSKCYYDNLMTMFAESKLAMMMMPADGDTIAELLKRGMDLNDIGIAPLPRGMESREHLTYGKCLIINSQLDRARRAAAFQWLMFMASPEVNRLRTQFFFREREVTAAPSVPLYSPQMQAQHYDSIMGYRSLPLWSDYESIVARHLNLEPSFHTDRFYEALAEGVRPIIERADSDPFQAVTQIASDFERKYIRREKPDNLLDRYVQYLVEMKEN